jgi:aspartyl-tRNA(Asn)/glutamyl-tRNA(Gln) amidotransferase subunit A
VRARVEDALQWFVAQGARSVPIRLPNAALALPVYYVLAPAEASSNLSRYDGVRYGYRASDCDDLLDMYVRTRTEGFGEEVKRRILVGTYVLSHGYYDAYYLQAQKLRRLIAQDFVDAYRDCDVILGPTTPTTAFALGSKMDDPVQMYLNDIYTIPAPLSGLPALSIPCGLDGQGLPVGLQLTGDYFAEARLLGIAHRYQQASDWHLRLPPEAPL